MELKKKSSSDWERAEQKGETLSWQQKIAKQTNGIVTVPNLLSVAGVLLEYSSHQDIAKQRLRPAVVKSLLATLCDLEGSWARKYGVSSDLGAHIDRGADAVKSAIRMVSFMKNDTIAPKKHIFAVGVPKIIAGVQSTIAFKKLGRDLKTHSVARIAEASRGLAGVALLGAKAVEHSHPRISSIARKVGTCAVGASLATGTLATIHYQSQLTFDSEKKSRS